MQDVPQSWDGRAEFMVANVLAAVAAARALGVQVEDLRDALTSFEPGRGNPGRINMLRVGEVPVVVDLAHNPAALAAVGSFLRRYWGREGVAVLTLPGNRTDALVVESAHAVAREFDRVVIYEDPAALRGRQPGEMTKLISAALTDVRPDIRWQSAADLSEAVTIGMALAAPTDPVLLVHLYHEKMDPVVSALYRCGAHVR